MSHVQREPKREVVVSSELRVYVGDLGALVIEQTFAGASYVVLQPADARALVAAISALTDTAIAKQAAVGVAIEAEYAAWLRQGRP